MAVSKVLMTGATGYVASRMLPTFRENYELVLLDVKENSPAGERVEGTIIADLIDQDISKYAKYFEGVDAVVHLGHKRRSGSPIEHYYDERQNVDMAYNVFRAAYDAGVPRVAMASSNHAADWYEHSLVHERKMEVVGPYRLPLSDNFYGWAKATYEHMGFLFACGAFGRKMGVVMVRIGHPREIQLSVHGTDPENYKRHLGAYISARDITQLFTRAIEAPNIENEHGNTRAFWSLSNARQVLGYQPEDDSEVKFHDDIQGYLMGEGAKGGVGRVGLS
jgi:NAD+ dependent glucose-6-phosphate dehydrogenase